MSKAILKLLMMYIFLITSISFGQISNFKHDLLLADINDETQLAISLAKTSETLNYITSHDLHIKNTTSNWIYLTINGKQLKNLLNSSISKQLYTEIGEPTLTNDTSRVHHQVNQVQQGLGGLQSSYNGNGILLGFIDTGVDFTHPDFKDSLGKTRIYSYWDQTVTTSTSRSPQPYNYGDNWTSADIDNAQCTAVDNVGHGTHVVGIAAGNGLANGRNKGMAPQSTIVMVKTNNNAKNWTLTVSDACDYIFKIADQLGKPCVINISYGVAMGSHDGTDPASELIESLLDNKPGRIIVAAAGNNGNIGKYHVHGDVTSDTSFFWVKNTLNGIAGTNSILIDLWSDSLKFKDVYFSTGVNLPNSNFALRGKTKFRSFQDAYAFAPNSLRDTLFNDKGVKMAYIDYYAEIVNHVYHLQTAYTKIDSTNYFFQFRTTGSGSFDVWGGSANKVGSKNFNDFVTTNLPSTSIYPSIANYLMADTLQTIFSSYISSEKVMTVGNVSNKAAYTTKDQVFHVSPYKPGEINVTSSKGPNRMGVTKPDIVASGTEIFSANPMNILNNPANNSIMDIGGYHVLNSGTSMASPLVAGIAALYLEKCSNSTYIDFKNDVISSAKHFNIEGVIPNFAYGNGEINALTLLLKTNPTTNVIGNTQIKCANPVSISINSSRGINSILWGDNDTKTNKTFSNPGKYPYQITDAKKCTFRDTLTITQLPIVKPKLSIIGNSTISCVNKTVTATISGGKSYQWSGGNNPKNDTVSFSSPGIYKVTITDSNLCTTSDSLTVLSDTILPTINFTFSKDSIINCTNKSVQVVATGGVKYNWFGGNQPYNDTNTFSESGVYSLEVTGVNGCVRSKNITISQDTVSPVLSLLAPNGLTINCSIPSISLIAKGAKSYQWTGGFNTNLDSNQYQLGGKYNVIGKNSNGCLSKLTFDIISDTAKPIVDLNYLGDSVLTCINKSVRLSMSGAQKYQWNGGSLYTNSVQEFFKAGTYQLNSIGFNFCKNIQTITIQGDTNIPNIKKIVSSPSSFTCSNSKVQVTLIGATNVQWDAGTTLNNSVNTFLQPGTYHFIANNSNGCLYNDSITLLLDTIPIPSSIQIIGQNLLTCYSKRIEVKASGGISYTWDGGNSIHTDTNSFNFPGKYTVSVMDTKGCNSKQFVVIQENTTPPNIAIDILSSPYITCDNQPVKVKVVGANKYTWNGGKYTNLDSNQFNIPGTYIVTATDVNGCISTDSIKVEQHNYPATPTIIQKDTLLIASIASNYQWYEDGNLVPGATKQSIVFTSGKTYFVSVKSFDCISSSDFFTPNEANIKTDELEFIQIYPNPTNDGKFIINGITNSDILNAYDVIGKKIGLLKIDDNKFQIETSVNGIYFISIVRNSDKMLVKIVKN